MDSKGFYYWFAGLTDGEGCFMVHARPDGSCQCVFRISMRNDDSPMLLNIIDELGFGFYKKQQRAEYFNGGLWHKPTSAFVVSSIPECIKLVKIFDEYPLRSKKSRDYTIWREAVLYAHSVYHKEADRSIMHRLSEQLMAVRKYEA